MKEKEKNKSDKIEDAEGTEESLDTSKLIIRNIKDLGIFTSHVSERLSLYRIDSLVAYRDGNVRPEQQRINNFPPDPFGTRETRIRATNQRAFMRPDGMVEIRQDEPNGDFVDIDGVILEYRRMPMSIVRMNVNQSVREIEALERDIATRRRMIENTTSPAAHRTHNGAIESTILRIRWVKAHLLRLGMNPQPGFTEEVDTYYKNEIKPTSRDKSFNEKRRDVYTNFTSKFGRNSKPALIKGYVIKNKLYTSNEELLKDINNISSNDLRTLRIIYKIFTLEEDESISYKIYCGTARDTIKALTSDNAIPPLLNILTQLKIKSTDISSQVFGLASQKKELQESLKGEYKLEPVKEWEVEFGSVKKLESDSYYVNIPIPKGNKKIKFLFADCELINPQLTGYTPPINKTFVVNSLVSVKEAKRGDYRLHEEKTEGIILAIKANLSSKKISKNCKSRRKDIITLKLIPSERIITVYAEDLKFIRRKYSNEPTEKKESKKDYINPYVAFDLDQTRLTMERHIHEAMHNMWATEPPRERQNVGRVFNNTNNTIATTNLVHPEEFENALDLNIDQIEF